MDEQERITYFAETDHRAKKKRFGIKQKDRTRHVYVIGKTGMGKSTLLENMAVQDIEHGHGFAFIDPHGGTADLLLEYIPEERKDDVLYFAPFDLEHPISFNVLEEVEPDRRHLVADGLMSAFKKIWVDMWSARMEYILNNVLLALLEYPDATLLGVNRMLADSTYRKRVVNNLTDVSVKAFWEDEFAKYGDRYMQEAGASIQNKIGQFVSSPLVRNIIGQTKTSFDIRKMMDEKKIMIVNLSKGRMGEDNANLIGSMLITKMYLAAMSRADVANVSIDKLPNFYFFVDEFQNFANESFAGILSEARKYKLNLTIAHQYIEQMTEEVRAAVFGNVGTLVSFRVGATDAEYLEKEFAPEFEAEDLVNLGFAQIYLKLMIDGIGSKPFSAHTLPPIGKTDKSNVEEIISLSRKKYAQPRKDVEENIIKWHESNAGVVSEEAKKKILATYKGDGVYVHPDEGTNKGGGSERNKKGSNKSSGSKGGSHSKGGSRGGSSRGNDKKGGRSQSHSSHSSGQGSGQKTGDKKDNKKSQQDREKRLQNAMSLNKLRNDEEKKKHEKSKAPSKEHLSELRNVLSSVLKGTKNEEDVKKAEKKGGDASESKKARGKEAEKNKKKKEEKKEEKKTDDLKNAQANSGNNGEMSADDLKKILEVD